MFCLNHPSSLIVQIYIITKFRKTNASPILLPDGQKMTPKPMAWGFPSFKGKGGIINARGETALDKTMFHRSVLERRCIVPTTGFYE
jgi:putative SOS response-associated peptidase YedK